MITAHGEKSLILYDGEREHTIQHKDFVPMKPHHKGGIHPAVTEDHQAWFLIESGMDPSTCPITPVAVEHADPARPGKTMKALYVPIMAYLQAHYGPDNHITTVPINGDSNAQRLHWLMRTDEERVQMRAFLEWLHPSVVIVDADGNERVVRGAWRLTDDGEVPE